MRDPQRSRVYAWEEAVVAPRDRSAIPFEQAQLLVDGVWLAEQLFYPPRVEPLPRQARRTWATGSRTTIRLPQDRRRQLMSFCTRSPMPSAPPWTATPTHTAPITSAFT